MEYTLTSCPGKYTCWKAEELVCKTYADLKPGDVTVLVHKEDRAKESSCKQKEERKKSRSRSQSHQSRKEGSPVEAEAGPTLGKIARPSPRAEPVCKRKDSDGDPDDYYVGEADTSAEE